MTTRKLALVLVVTIIGGTAASAAVNTGLSCCMNHVCCHDGAKCMMNHKEAYLDCRPPVCK
jgi:hypothetical protein